MKYFDGDWNEREDGLQQDVADYQAQRQQLESEQEGRDCSEKEIADLGRCIGHLGEACRLSGLWTAAFEARTAALAGWTGLQRPRALYLARLRLAILQESIRVSGTPEEQALVTPLDAGYAALLELRAEMAGEPQTFTPVSIEQPGEQLSESEHIRVARGDDLSVYADFVHEAVAIAYLRRGQHLEANAELAAALAIRSQRGQRAMIERTRQLMDRLARAFD